MNDSVGRRAAARGFAFLFGLFCFATAHAQSAAPEFEVQRLDGAGSLSLSTLRGKVVLVDFWASWCGPCVHTLAMYEAAAKKHPDDLAVLAISVDTAPADAREFLREVQVSFPTAIDSEQKVQRLFQVRGIPSSYLIDRDGRIVRNFVGLPNPDELNTEIDRLVAAARESGPE